MPTCGLKFPEVCIFLSRPLRQVADDTDKEIEHGKACDDMWALDLTKTSAHWERVKKQGMAPGPRASFAMMAHKGRALLFGGVRLDRSLQDRIFEDSSG